jgi:hypothetical protein
VPQAIPQVTSREPPSANKRESSTFHSTCDVLTSNINDSGVRSLRAVIEFKLAKDTKGLKMATSGLFEDASGYKASADWSRFYSVIYMTGAHGTEEQLLADFDRAGMIAWTPILVTGQGKPKGFSNTKRSRLQRTGGKR